MGIDIVVVGGGHAGTEAAAAAARLGCKVVLVTLQSSAIARLSCNPAIGGLAKGHLVREIDVLGGLMGRAADEACIQFRRLNTRKGLALQSSRAQVDVDIYPEVVQRLLRETEGVEVLEDEVVALHVEGGAVQGVDVKKHGRIDARAVILTTGTFLAGVLHTGDKAVTGGRVGEDAASILSDSLRAAGLRMFRLKTGTVPRVRASTVDWDRLEVQEDTDASGHFSYEAVPRRLAQITCHLTYTNATTHAIVRDNLGLSAMYGGHIHDARGPRYCPSIEDKIVRFADRERHLLFLEPEGLQSEQVYVNGLSNSLPAAVQEDLVHSVEGLEHAEILRYGYAVTYDVSDPRDLDHGLQHRGVRGLYLAGQINGTSGYEEAGAQGLVAGASAALGVPLEIGRHEAYIGVMIDDLVSRGVGGEPYRMFPSRAEHRLRLREDNADRRLMDLAKRSGLARKAAETGFIERETQRLAALDRLTHTRLAPSVTRAFFESHDFPLPAPGTASLALLRRPEVHWDDVVAWMPELANIPRSVGESLEVDVKYEGYIHRAERRASAAASRENVRLPDDLAWDKIPSLSTEVRERAEAAHPTTLGAFARIPGITPVAVGIVAEWLAHRHAESTAP